MAEKQDLEAKEAAKEAFKQTSIIKTGVICALAGAMGGGIYVDKSQEEDVASILESSRKNSESIIQYFKSEIENLKEKAEPYSDYWSELKAQIWQLDSLNKELNYTYELLVKENSEMKQTIEKQQNDITHYEKDFGGRYSIEKEFALIYECIYGSNQGYNSYSGYGYTSFRDCCVKAVRQLQKQYPTENKLQEWQSISKFKCEE
ncbi:MAG: hypothetical protein MJY78_06965 [Fibrobacter sp.]|nr:hypothetical protein [Fibrobacter sp.]